MKSSAGVVAEITCLTVPGEPWIKYSPSHDPMLRQRDPLHFPFGNRKFDFYVRLFKCVVWSLLNRLPLWLSW